MNCLDFGLLLDEQLDGSLDTEAETRCEQHAAVCASCARRRQQALQLQWTLRALPTARPDAGFADRVLAAARDCQPAAEAARTRRFALPAWPGALAAGLLLGIGVLSWNTRETLPEVHAGALEPVRLVFRSDSALSGVTIELDLPEGVELAGYPGERHIEWQSDLLAGENLLELPVRASGAGGVLTATLNLGAERRQFSVRVMADKHPAPVTRAVTAGLPVVAARPASAEVLHHA